MAVDLYLKLDGIKGESQTKGLEDQVELLSFDWAVSNATPVAGDGAGAGKATLGNIRFTKNVDSASTLLFLDCCKGTHIGNGKISGVKAGETSEVFLAFDLLEVTIASYAVDIKAQVPVETVSLSYKSIQMSYSAQDGTGAVAKPVTSGWDVTKNAAV